jgi:N-acetylglucosaminyldiphosphoundecaprenol N-acetyl-beta-D-mannosaminyltransferase
MNIIKTLKEKTMSSDALAPKGIVMFLNPYTYLMLRKMPDLLGEASYIYIDGEWLRKFMSWFAIKEIKRVSFDNTSLAPIVFKDSIDIMHI